MGFFFIGCSVLPDKVTTARLHGTLAEKCNFSMKRGSKFFPPYRALVAFSPDNYRSAYADKSVKIAARSPK